MIVLIMLNAYSKLLVSVNEDSATNRFKTFYQ